MCGSPIVVRDDHLETGLTEVVDVTISLQGKRQVMCLAHLLGRLSLTCVPVFLAVACVRDVTMCPSRALVRGDVSLSHAVGKTSVTW